MKFWETERVREFHRDGVQKGLVEIKSVCRNPKVKSNGHLVKNDSSKPCFEKGKYVSKKKIPKKEKNF